jgi:hypothetical protein
MKDKEFIEIVSRATAFLDLVIEVKMALGFLRAFLKENDDFSDLYKDICDSYGALVDAQMNLCYLESLNENLKRKYNKCAN